MSFNGECTTNEGAVEIGNVTACETGPNADPTKSCDNGQFCELDTGVCNAKSAVFDGVCTDIPEACTFEYNPVRIHVQGQRVRFHHPMSQHHHLVFSLTH